MGFRCQLHLPVATAAGDDVEGSWSAGGGVEGPWAAANHVDSRVAGGDVAICCAQLMVWIVTAPVLR